MAREGLLLHDDEQPEPPQAPEPAEPRKRWENFWYYHKWHVVIALFILIVGGYMAFDAMKTRKPDYQIGMITQATCPADAVEKLENEIARSGTDRNGDGRVVVQINEYVTGFGENVQNAQLEMASRVKLQAALTTGDSILFITDEKSFASTQKDYSIFSLTDGGKPSGKAEMRKLRVPFSKCPKLSALKYEDKLSSASSVDVYEGLGLSLRQYKGTAIDGKEDDYYAASKKLFQKLTAK